MEPETMQEQMGVEDAKASLGLATRLQEQHLMSMAPQEALGGSVEGENASEQEMGMETEKEPQEDKMMAMEGKMDEKMEILRTELKDTIKLEVEGIKNILKEALNEEDED